MTPHPGDGFTPSDLWEIAVHVGPILIAVVAATFKIVKVLRDEIRGEIGPIMTRIDAMESRFVSTVRELWDHNNSQDIRIDAVTAAHHRLRGAHDAIVGMGGGHHQMKIEPGYSGPERRHEARPPKCTEPG